MRKNSYHTTDQTMQAQNWEMEVTSYACAIFLSFQHKVLSFVGVINFSKINTFSEEQLTSFQNEVRFTNCACGCSLVLEDIR